MFPLKNPFSQSRFFSWGKIVNQSNYNKNYYPFGSPMVGRGWEAGNTGDYRFGMNGQEKDDEIYGKGNSTSAEFWQYDARLGRRWNVDPLAAEAPGWSPYRAFYDNPIYWKDPTGAIEYESAEAFAKANKGKTWDKDRGKGDWLKSDRENNTDIWSNANKFNLQQEGGNLQYCTITERTAFYGWFQKQTDAKGFETKWAGAAYVIAQQMSLMEDPLIASMTDKAVIKFANDGNKAIFDDVFDNLKDLYNGGVLKGEAASNWDAATLTHEQRDVVQPIYARQTAETIKTLQSLAQGIGYKATLGYMFDRRFPIGGPLKFEGNISNWQDRYNHGMNKAVPFYKKYGSLFNWNRPGDGRIDTALDPDNPGLLKYGEPKF